MIAFLRRRFWPALLACFALMALILLLMPGEKTLGPVIKIVYLHGALSRAGMIGFWAAGIAGVATLFRRRAALARAIALDPMMIMYDEPFAGQDPIVMGVLTRLIRSLREALDLTTIVVSHDVSETLSIADYIYVVAEGKIQGEGSPEQLKNHASPFVRQFLTGSVEGPVEYQFTHQAYLDNEVRP